MNLLLFGISNVGKTTTGKIIAEMLNVSFYDMDEEIKRYYGITLEEFVSRGTIEQRDAKRGKILKELVQRPEHKVISLTPMSYSQHFKDVLKSKDVLAIELRDSAENIFDRLVFSDENDVIYVDDEYKMRHKKYYLSEINKDLEWYGGVYKCIKNKFDINNKAPKDVASQIIEIYELDKLFK